MFKTHEGLKNHDLRVHANIKKYKSCHICNTRVVSIKDHMNIHTGQKPYACEFANCSKSFNNSLMRHTNRHKGITFDCDLCVYKAPQKDSLFKHKKAIHEELKFSCDKCGHTVSWEGNLAKHVKAGKCVAAVNNIEKI